MIINDIVIKLAETLYPASDAMDAALAALPEGQLRDQTTAAAIALQEAYHTLVASLVAEVTDRRTGDLTGTPEQPSDTDTIRRLVELDVEFPS